MKKRLLSVVAALSVLLATCTAAPRPAAAQDSPDTRFGNYEEAPYRQIVQIHNVPIGTLTFRYVEIPEQYVFQPQWLDRTVVIGGREWKDLVIVYRQASLVPGEDGMRFYVWDLFEERPDDAQYLRDVLDPSHWAPTVPPEQRQQAIDDAYYGAIRLALQDWVAKLWDWPNSEAIVSINGRPWQETEWRDFILDTVKTALKPTDPILADSRFWEVFTNPAYNGHAWETLNAPPPVNEPPATPPNPPANQPPAPPSNPPVNQPPTTPPNPPTNQPPASPATFAERVVLALGSRWVTRSRAGSIETAALDTPATAEGGVTFVPLRGVLDHFGAQLAYSDGTVTVTSGSHKIILRINSPVAQVDGRTVRLLRPPIIRAGRTLVPLRFIAEALGYYVTWDPDTRLISIEQPPSATSPQRVVLTLDSRLVIRSRPGVIEAATLDTPATAEGGVTFVPLRGVLDHFGAQLAYSDGTVTVTSGSHKIILRINSPLALVDGRTVRLLRPPIIRSGRTLIPVRFISEALGYSVIWDPNTRQVTIVK